MKLHIFHIRTKRTLFQKAHNSDLGTLVIINNDRLDSEKCPGVPTAAALKLKKNFECDSMGSTILERPIEVWPESWSDDVHKSRSNRHKTYSGYLWTVWSRME